MRLNDINFNLLSDQELVTLCLKYKLIQQDDVSNVNRKQLLNIIKQFLKQKLQTYGQRKRTLSTSANIQNNRGSNLPRPIIQRQTSNPITRIERSNVVHEHNTEELRSNTQTQIQQEVKSMNPQYDVIGMYPPVPKLIAVGDLHGDLRVTLLALKLAEVIPQNATESNLNDVHWCGGSTWVIQLGDQIDRCRPDDWEKNCIKKFDSVFEDEGNNMTIIKLLLRLDDEATKCGGRVLGLLGNHEIMNVDKDFRYVSPQEFLEFVPESDRSSTYTKDGFPLGYYHRTKAFERGSNMAKLYSIKKKSIISVGSFVFVHGGISVDLASKYTIGEINHVVTKWMCKNNNATEEKIFDEIFRDDDDMSPFWCRIFAEEDGHGENTEQNFNKMIQLLNQRNKLITPIKGMVIAHTPQFMENKYLNSIYDDRLWRIDVGMSRAFGKHSDCGEDKYRQIQILVIHDDNRFEVRKKPFNNDRHPSEGMGTNATLHNPSFL